MGKLSIELIVIGLFLVFYILVIGAKIGGKIRDTVEEA